MWDLIVLIPGHCLSIYFTIKYSRTRTVMQLHTSLHENLALEKEVLVDVDYEDNENEDHQSTDLINNFGLPCKCRAVELKDEHMTKTLRCQKKSKERKNNKLLHAIKRDGFHTSVRLLTAIIDPLSISSL